MLASSIEESPENENSPVTEPEVPLVENFDETVDSADHCDCPVVDNQPVMMYYFSRKVFYSCMVAAFASIIVHQYRGKNLVWFFTISFSNHLHYLFYRLPN